MRLGTVLSKTFDENNHERRVQIRAIISCPTCGKDVELTSETEEWHKEPNGPRWLHASYDCCPSGECCGKILIYNGLEGKLLTLDPSVKAPNSSGGAEREGESS